MVQSIKQKQFWKWESVLITLAACRTFLIHKVPLRITLRRQGGAAHRPDRVPSLPERPQASALMRGAGDQGDWIQSPGEGAAPAQ